VVTGELDLKKSALGLVGSVIVCAAALACSQTPQNVTSPSAAIGGNNAATATDGSTLKVSAPPIIEPIESREADSKNPTLIWANSTGKYEGTSLEYEIELYDAAQKLIYTTVAGETPNTGSHRVPVDLSLDASYNWRIRARFATMSGPWSGYAEFRTPKPVVATPPPGSGGGVIAGNGFRTPDPPPGQRLARPNHLANIQAFASLNPSFLRNSCQPEGGNWNFMDGAVDTLQAIDLRYGYNCKRGNCNDPSLDVISYHWGAGPEEGSSEVYCTDLISGHCGGTPGLIWNDVTGVTLDSGTVCRVMFTRPGRKR